MKKAIRTSFFILTLICYVSVFFSPEVFWGFGFLSLAIPIVLCFHAVLLIINIPRLKKAFFFHLAAILIGLAFVRVSYSISVQDVVQDGDGALQVLSYNVRVFNNYSNLRNEDYASSKKMIAWSVDNPADIKCFQEYYNKDNSGIFNIKNKLIASDWKYIHSKIVMKDRSGAEFGMAIFSKHPIVHAGEICDGDARFLNSIFADIRIEEDTIRIYNTHLESMSINEENVVNTDKLARSYIDTGYRLRNGFISRSFQVKSLVNHIKTCPYKIILCGDLNEVPYSFAYFSIRNHLRNAFEKAGNGFGFTYNGKLFFLRIDNQFFSPEINIHDFFTHRNVDYSDHFPLTATYSW
jgi:endonuclease/exonuclease/phosphatase family metal-dependent hydrolase